MVLAQPCGLLCEWRCTMHDLTIWQYALIALLFVWSGLVRSGLGFGGAALTLPFLLLLVNDPLVFLPIIAVQLLFFSGLIIWKGRRISRAAVHHEPTTDNIDWVWLRWSLKIMIVPKLIGVLGLLTLPPKIMSTVIFLIVLCYALGYFLNRPIRSNNRKLDSILLIVGGYASGVSLIGAPLIAAVAAARVSQHQLRDTLFVLWPLLVLIKLVSFIIAGVDLQLIHHLWLLPCAWIGHIFGERLHQRIVAVETPVFFRALGTVLIVVSLAGILWKP